MTEEGSEEGEYVLSYTTPISNGCLVIFDICRVVDVKKKKKSCIEGRKEEEVRSGRRGGFQAFNWEAGKGNSMSPFNSVSASYCDI